MPKMKTRKSVSSKFRVTGTGKLVRSQAVRRHILTSKSPKRKRQLRRPELVFEAYAHTYKRLMGVV